MDTYKTLGGLVQCNQCTAHARRSEWQRCLLPAMKGKSVEETQKVKETIKTEVCVQQTHIAEGSWF